MADKEIGILLVDDDSRTLRLEQHVMEKEGYNVLVASSGEEGIDLLAETAPDLVLLDVGLPGMDGFATCQRIREFSQVPVIMVTGKDNDDDKVHGLEIGADDYVTKPFSVRELAARVRATLRRANIVESLNQPTLQVGELVVDFTRNRVMMSGDEVVLSDIEYRLLSYLARNAGRIVTPDQIIDNVWSDDYSGEYHLLHVTVSRLRQKLGDDPRRPRYIMMRRGIGYSLSLDEELHASNRA